MEKQRATAEERGAIIKPRDHMIDPYLDLQLLTREPTAFLCRQRQLLERFAISC
jgi:hypothetical protein